MGSYQVDVSAEARAQVRQLPGNMRQRVVRMLRELEAEPRPHTSKALDVSELAVQLPEQTEARRIRVEGWRIIYAVEEAFQRVQVLAIRKRPPYRYEDLERLLDELS
jgi:mRNA-degrading endonuclease RelE of RelBE toxin-antitoxin system